MAGVEILATEEVVSEYGFNWIVFIAVFGIFFIAGLVLGILAIADKEVGGGIFVIIFTLVFGVFVGYGTGAGFGKPIAYKNQYKVTIEERESDEHKTF